MSKSLEVGDLVKVMRGQYAEREVVGVIIEVFPGPVSSARYRVWTSSGRMPHDIGPLFEHEMRRVERAEDE